MKILLEQHFESIHGLVHCSGGGQTKCMKYLPQPFKIIKDNLFKPPHVFDIIQENSGSSLKEMYEVFNMGCRMEIFCEEKDADNIIALAATFNIDFLQRPKPVDKGFCFNRRPLQNVYISPT